ncbi:NAD(P)-dependent oxidoreductase [Thermoactinospora rubra]|uniref:NAD(P)-dependent oxidoreductase n=1 Tax=Thermoactinospora rubra TaxID=1088767 RepID=UPI000A1038AC|nr:NAD(P)H-binding protein [Thermoactinospora rubra]
MRLTVFGATGGTGRHFVRKALAEGHVVTAVARRPEAVTESHPGLSVVQGDVLGPVTIEPDSHAVVFLAGPTRPGPSTIYSEGGPNVVAAMLEAGVKRLVAVTTALANTPADTPVQRLSKILLHSTVLRHPYRESERLLRFLQDAPLDWTVVRPPRLSDRPATGRYRMAVGTGLRSGYGIGREDLADAVLRVLPDPATHRRTVDVAY